MLQSCRKIYYPSSQIPSELEISFKRPRARAHFTGSALKVGKTPATARRHSEVTNKHVILLVIISSWCHHKINKNCKVFQAYWQFKSYFYKKSCQCRFNKTRYVWIYTYWANIYLMFSLLEPFYPCRKATKILNWVEKMVVCYLKGMLKTN